MVTPEGFPLGYEVLPGNTVDSTTLRGILKTMEAGYGNQGMRPGVHCSNLSPREKKTVLVVVIVNDVEHLDIDPWY